MEYLKQLFKNQNITEWGICRYSSLPAPFEVKSKDRLPNNPQSVITALFPYGYNFNKNRNLCKYAVFTDYHITVNEILKSVSSALKEKYPDYQFVHFTDSSPINEVEAAVLSGVGLRGKNQLLINKKYGSYVFIGTIVTDMVFAYSDKNNEQCLGCDRCINACPGKALTQNGVEVFKCLSYITQKKGDLTDEEQALIKKQGLVWGCDVCNDVCPLNKNAEISPLDNIVANPKEILNYDNLDEDYKTRSYSFRGKKVILRNLELFD